MWQIKLAISTAKALMPFQDEFRGLKRRFSPYRGDAGNCDFALTQGLDQIANLQRLGFPLENAEVLDLGSGWNPVIPLLFRVAGARIVHLTDLERLLDRGTIAQAAGIVMKRSEEIERRIGVPRERMAELLTLADGMDLGGCLSRLGLTYTVPFDSKHDMRPVDLIISRTVLEHIPPVTLLCLLREFRDYLRPGGAMYHVIDHSDHREHFDKSISRIEFLRCSDMFWKLLCINPQDYTNRLRHSEYVSLMRDAGYDIMVEEREIDPQARKDAETMKLWGRFSEMSPDEIATLTSHIVARPLARIIHEQ